MMQEGEYELRLAQTVDVEMAVISFLTEYGEYGAAHLSRVIDHYLGGTTPCDCDEPTGQPLPVDRPEPRPAPRRDRRRRPYDTPLDGMDGWTP